MDIADRLFAIIQRGSSSQSKRIAAFEQLLQLTSGFWGSGSLRSYLVADASSWARRLTRNRGADLLDPEGIADKTLCTFFDCAPGMEIHPKQWLKRKVRSNAREAMAREKPFLVAQRLYRTNPETNEEYGLELSSPEPTPPETAEDIEASQAAEAEINEALSRLSPTLRRVAQLKLFEPELSMISIAKRLRIKAATARQRWRRARHRLQGLLQGLLTQRRNQSRRAA